MKIYQTEICNNGCVKMINITFDNEPMGSEILIKRFGQHAVVERGYLDYSVNDVCRQLNPMFVWTQPVFIISLIMATIVDCDALRARNIF